MTNKIDELQELIDAFNKLNIKEPNGPTFLEIAKRAHSENVWSNILAFYIDPNREHNLHELLLKSIFQLTNKDVVLSNLEEVRVKREYSTIKGNRIDIVVTANNFVLGIENKVEAGLYNDLADYSETIDELAKGHSLPTYKIVLSKDRISTDINTYGFLNLIYTDLKRKIRTNIGEFTDYSDTKYLVFLLDFLKNMGDNTMKDNLEVIDFFLKNLDKINKLVKYHYGLNAELLKKLDNIDQLLNRDSIESELSKTGKKTFLIGSAPDKIRGRFTWEGHDLIKYNIIINDVSLLFYQVGISDYKLYSYYWLASDEEPKDEVVYEYNETAEEIAKKVEEGIKKSIREKF